MEQVYTPTEDYKVLVNCMTYNQSKYIEDALNGFAMQKTDFPFVCLVMDDASTDGEQEVIKAWMERECDMEKAENHEIEKSFITLVSHKSNPNCTFAFYFLKGNLYGTGKKTPLIAPWLEHCEYVAVCEGDDYWINENKLQIQMEWLEDHPICGIVGSAAYYLNQLSGNKEFVPLSNNRIDFHHVLICGGIGMPTCTIMYRKCAYEGYDDFVRGHHWPLGDLPLWLWILHKYEIKRFEKGLAIYRVLPSSASHHLTYESAYRFDLAIRDIQMLYAKSFSPESVFDIEACAGKRMFYTSVAYGKIKEAIRCMKSFKPSLKDYCLVVKSVFIHK